MFAQRSTVQSNSEVYSSFARIYINPEMCGERCLG